MLVERGADPTILNEDGCNVLDISSNHVKLAILSKYPSKLNTDSIPTSILKAVWQADLHSLRKMLVSFTPTVIPYTTSTPPLLPCTPYFPSTPPLHPYTSPKPLTQYTFPKPPLHPTPPLHPLYTPYTPSTPPLRPLYSPYTSLHPLYTPTPPLHPLYTPYTTSTPQLLPYTP